jgi:hypothetical protein
MTTLTFTTGTEVIAAFGQPLTAKRKTLVRIRPTVGTEVFPRERGDLTAVEGIDYVLMPVDGSQPYPCKVDIFPGSWEETEPNSGLYRRSALCKFVPVPAGYTVTIKMREGDATVSHPDYVAIGIDDEVYSYSSDWVRDNLVVV